MIAQHLIADTIVAIASAQGVGAIGLVRISGSDAITIAQKIFKGKDLSTQAGYTLHFGKIVSYDQDHKEAIIDEVLLSLFRNPKSYTGEDMVEISAHGSPYILEKIVQVAIDAGARLAQAGEFTQRAFLNGKLDLTQAEAVADLIAAQSKAAHQNALNHLKGGFSAQLNKLRNQLIEFTALIELELDFSQEDVEFANRKDLEQLIQTLKTETHKILQSFKLGNAIKNGLSVALIGPPNAGKSTLLNALLNEERAIVSPIAGTTRDSIEEQLNIQGIIFRIIDTAGIRHSKGDTIEDIGMLKSKSNAEKADIILRLHSLIDPDHEDSMDWVDTFASKTIHVYNKKDQFIEQTNNAALPTLPEQSILISAKNNDGIEAIKEALFNRVSLNVENQSQSLLNNVRHQEALLQVAQSLQDIEQAMAQNISGELLALDIRRCLYYLGSITGQVEIDRDILGAIFGKFCIGK